MSPRTLSREDTVRRAPLLVLCVVLLLVSAVLHGFGESTAGYLAAAVGFLALAGHFAMRMWTRS